MNENITYTYTEVLQHKYWYDILMGFKAELLVAYLVTLLFIVALVVINSVNEEVKRSHEIKLRDCVAELYELETDRLQA